MIMYMVEVKNVKNLATDKITYFQLVCGAWQRISKAKYRRLTSHADRADSFSTDLYFRHCLPLPYRKISIKVLTPAVGVL